MQSGQLGLILVLAMVIGAVVTRKVELCIITVSMIACIYLYGANFITQWCLLLQETLENNAWVMLLVGIFGSLIALIQASKGHLGFSRIIDRLCKSERKTLFVTFIMGVLIFMDEFMNVLTISACMKNHYDKEKIPREALAFLLNSTGTPVCVLIPVSGWGICYISIFMEEEGFQALGPDGIVNYLKAVPFCFYPIFLLIVVLLFCAGVMPKLGGMKKAYDRVRLTGQLYDERNRKYNQQTDDDELGEGSVADFIIPMVVMIVIAVVTGDLIPATVIAIAVCLVMYVPRKIISLGDFFPTIVKGFGDMLPVLSILLLTYQFQIIVEKLYLTEYLIELVKPYMISFLFPMIVFILVAGLCFCTASLLGICALVSPIVFPLGAAVGANTILIMAAIISGGAFGSHACFYSDVTIVTSNCAGISNIDHALSQFPYVIISAVLSIIAFAVAGLIMT